jgi:hypothetical protein
MYRCDTRHDKIHPRYRGGFYLSFQLLAGQLTQRWTHSVWNGVARILASDPKNTPAAPAVAARPRQRQTRPDKAKVAAMVADYTAGMPLYTVAKRHGVRHETARRHLVRSGVAIRPMKIGIPKSDLRVAYQLRQDRWTLDAIGEKYGCSRTAVANALTKFAQAAES